MTWLQWISLVEIPALLGIAAWLLKMQAGHNKSLVAFANYKTEVEAYKVEIAEKYASIAYLRDVDRRIDDRLKRIEDMLQDLLKAEHGR